MARAAAGIQCNGPNSYAAYARWSQNAHQYFDTRVREEERSRAEQSPDMEPLKTLRIGFSGRWMQQKGPDTAVRVVNDLAAQGVDISLSMFGGGPMEADLRSIAGPAVELVGPLDFHDSWVPRITATIDVMLLPHPQSDSASTYLEAMSCGAPVVAYANKYWRDFHDMHHAGWTVPRDDSAALTSVIAELASDPDQIMAARGRGLAWAADHTFEKEFEARVHHIRVAANA